MKRGGRDPAPPAPGLEIRSACSRCSSPINLGRELQMIAHPPSRVTLKKRPAFWVFERLDTFRRVHIDVHEALEILCHESRGAAPGHTAMPGRDQQRSSGRGVSGRGRGFAIDACPDPSRAPPRRSSSGTNDLDVPSSVTLWHTSHRPRRYSSPPGAPGHPGPALAVARFRSRRHAGRPPRKRPVDPRDTGGDPAPPQGPLCPPAGGKEPRVRIADPAPPRRRNGRKPVKAVLDASALLASPSFSTHLRKCRVFEVYPSGRRINTRGRVSNWL